MWSLHVCGPCMCASREGQPRAPGAHTLGVRWPPRQLREEGGLTSHHRGNWAATQLYAGGWGPGGWMSLCFGETPVLPNCVGPGKSLSLSEP